MKSVKREVTYLIAWLSEHVVATLRWRSSVADWSGLFGTRLGVLSARLDRPL